MRNITAILIAAHIALLTLEAAAQERFAGDWTMKRTVIDVSVESWGPDCGVKPKSFSSSPNTPVKIKVSGGHLFFSSGDIRTDACGSMNPKVHSVLSKKSDGRWKRICKTAQDDPKSEQGEYLLEATDDNRLEYTATSKFDWTLKGDHCVASSVERRTYTRTNSPTSPPTSPPPPDSPPKVPSNPPNEDEPSGPIPDSDENLDKPECMTPGPPIRVDLSPRSAVIGPGERVCLTASAVDAHGCKTAEDKRIIWTAEQDGRAIPRLISSAGCFQAGDTAADSEGTYLVKAAVGTRTGTAEITVAFPDLGELFAARLRPLEDVAAAPSSPSENLPEVEKAQASAAVTASTAPPASPTVPLPAGRGTSPAEAENNTGYFLALIVAAMLLLVATVIVFLKKRRAALKKEEEEDNDDDFEQSLLVQKYPTLVSSPPAEAPKPANVTNRVKGKICPTCGNRFDIFAQFCPYDKSDLILIPTASQDAPGGKICPKCHRGYEGDAQFCPHDAAKLIPYSEWRLSKLPPAP